MTQRNTEPALHFVWLEVDDLTRSRDFYVEVLQLPLRESGDEFVAVGLGKTTLYLAPGRPQFASMYLAIAAPDIDQLYQRLLEHGVDVAPPQDEGWARYIEMTDPDGYRLLLLTPAEDAA
jgi:predicted enzyme related to lactoylglutathione lyase